MIRVKGGLGLKLIARFKEYIKEYDLLKNGDSLIIGVSGGPDSLTLFHLLNSLKKEYNLYLVVFHLNHMFRKEASAEAEYVRGIAKRYEIKAIIEEYDVPAYIQKEGLSPEEAARKVRFNLLKKWAGKLDIKKVALAHNKDDLVETVFLNITRGSGLQGLTGINPLTEIDGINFIHPLLDIYREEIENYCQENNLKPVYDQTNNEVIYTRNKLRHKVIPYLEKEINPRLKGAVSRMAAHLRSVENFLSRITQEKLAEILLENNKHRIVLSLSAIQKEEQLIRRRLVKGVIGLLRGDVIDLYTVHYKAIDKLICAGETGKKIPIKEELQIRISYDKLIFEIKNRGKKVSSYNKRLTVPGETLLSNKVVIKTWIIPFYNDWQQDAFSQDICFCDYNKIDLPLFVRNRRNGDRFKPLGMKGEKKIKDFYIDEKVPLNKRDKTPIIVDNKDRVLWIVGMRMDDRFKVSPDTANILKIGIKYPGGD
ncbi:tRNA lysidine(34) synthetase TilS [Iocasia frigidifontis]|uniref:tRNA(Ile)-lysidine synthase n=1 Tax=Iocasia fonsfrigidae TaxID=2682810 RepID=A0A8A7KBY5_9FIRM|nr:tRNA lysidine(34) synthetase TilS [Iocasia fonsfrigidae]